MRLLKEILEKDVKSVVSEDELVNIHRAPRNRRAVRAVVFDADGNIALLHVSKNKYYKLPGGGIEEGEEIIQALIRECQEEIGCNIKVDEEVGEVIEYRDQHRFRQISYCYTAKVIGDKGSPNLEQEEIDEGFKEVWVSLDEAICLLKESEPTSYNGPFIVMRDLKMLEEVKSMRH